MDFSSDAECREQLNLTRRQLEDLVVRFYDLSRPHWKPTQPGPLLMSKVYRLLKKLMGRDLTRKERNLTYTYTCYAANRVLNRLEG